MGDAAFIAASAPGVHSSRSQIGRWLLLVGRIALGALFVYSAYTKLSQPWMLFAMSVDSYHMLPDWGVTLVARGLPWFELALGLAIWTGIALRWSATISTLLLGFFFGAMLRAHYKHLEIDCGCFGVGEKLDGRRIALEILLLLLALGVAIGGFIAHRRASQSS